MNCKSCGSKWESKSQLKNCPFCGADIQNEIPTEFGSITSVLSFLIDREGIDILLDPNRVMAYIMDLVQGAEREKRLFRIGCKNGVLQTMHKILSEESSSKRKILVLNLKQHIINYAFFSEENAVCIINMSLEGIGAPELKLPVNNAEEKAAPQKTEPQESLQEQSKSEQAKKEKSDVPENTPEQPKNKADGAEKASKPSENKNETNEEASKQKKKVKKKNQNKT